MTNKIVTHFRPHADELIALMFLKNFRNGEEKFPGVKNAKIEFLSSGKLPNGQTYKDFPDTIFLGVGGGPFDEHAGADQERAEGEVCATMVAKYLGLDSKPELQGILNIVKDEDLSGAKEKDSLSVIVKFLHSCFKENYELIYKWSEIAYMAHINNFLNKGSSKLFTLSDTKKILEATNHPEFAWWVETASKAHEYQDSEYKKALEEYKIKAKVERFIASDGLPVDMAVISSDSEEMNRAARSNKMQLIVQFNGRGNVAIFTYRKRNLNLTKSFVLLRMAEQHYRGRIMIKDEKILGEEGTIEDIPWYLFHTRDMGFNGSLTTSEIEPTRIPHNKISELVKEGLKGY